MKFFAFSQIALMILASCSDFYQKNHISINKGEPIKTCWSADMVREEQQHVDQSNYHRLPIERKAEA